MVPINLGLVDAQPTMELIKQCSDSMCMISCISSQQCPSSQVCSNGVCAIGCRSNSNCPTNEVCISFKCIDPCSQEGAGGPNALCKIVNKNVRKGKQKNFHTKGDDTTTRNFEYDYDSIMHYGPYYFRYSEMISGL